MVDIVCIDVGKGLPKVGDFVQCGPIDMDTVLHITATLERSDDLVFECERHEISLESNHEFYEADEIDHVELVDDEIFNKIFDCDTYIVLY